MLPSTSVRTSSAQLGSAQLQLSSAHCYTSMGLGGEGTAESQSSDHAGEPCPSSVPFHPGLFRPSSLLGYHGTYSVVIPAHCAGVTLVA